MKLVNSLPALNATTIQALEAILLEQFDYPSLPADYRDFLLEHNGGHVVPGRGSDDESTHEIVFDTPLVWVRADNRQVRPSLITFFGAWLPAHMNEADLVDEEMLELIASNEHSQHEFDVLPDRMMSIARCSHPQASDMLCLGLDSRDFGHVYYNYGMVHHPLRAHGDYYDKRRQEILKKYGLRSAADAKPDTQAGSDALFELQRVEFVKVADSFKEFLSNCRVEAA